MSSLPIEFRHECPPYAHQKDCLEKSWHKPYYALFLDMGCGKSKILIDTAAALYLAGKIDAVLLLAPKGVYKNWPNNELPTHWPKHLPMTVSTSDVDPDKGLFWLVMNIEALSYQSGVTRAAKLVGRFGSRVLVAVDESTTIKNIRAKRTQVLIKLTRRAAYRRILTGDPIPKGPLDLFSQGLFLSPQALGFTSFYAFRSRYCEVVEWGVNGRMFKIVTGYQRLDELKDRVKTFSYRVTKDQCLDLPPKVYQTWDVELTPQQAKLYKEMKASAMAELTRDKIATATVVLTQLTRLHQITCGFFKPDVGDEVDLESYRLQALLDAVDAISGKVLIWATYRRNIKTIIEHLGRDYGANSVVGYYGDTSDADRQDGIERFQKGDARFFVGNPATGRFGLTLTASSSVIYYSNSYDLEHRTQSEDRVHRIGQQATSVNYIDLIARGTVDERIISALKLKRRISAMVNGDEIREWFK